MTLLNRTKLYMNNMLVNKPLGLTLVAIIPVVLFVFSIYVSTNGKGITFPTRKTPPTQELAPEEPKQTPELSVFEDQLKPLYTDPQALEITTLGVNVPVSIVGVAKDGTMETPKNWGEAGWYWKSSHPGEEGNLIINGHYDDSSGKPAAFWQLKNITVGDRVLVTDKYSNTFTYQVRDVFFVSIQDPQRLDVLQSDASRSTLTLITCGGVWLPGKSTYDQRLVVKGDLVLDTDTVM